MSSETVRVGRTYEVQYRGSTYRGTVRRIARMRTGAVIAFLEEERGFVIGIPVSKYAVWSGLEVMADAH